VQIIHLDTQSPRKCYLMILKWCIISAHITLLSPPLSSSPWWKHNIHMSALNPFRKHNQNLINFKLVNSRGVFLGFFFSSLDTTITSFDFSKYLELIFELFCFIIIFCNFTIILNEIIDFTHIGWYINFVFNNISLFYIMVLFTTFTTLLNGLVFI